MLLTWAQGLGILPVAPDERPRIASEQVQQGPRVLT